MAMFGSSSAATLASTADVIDALDERVHVLFALLQKSAGVLSEVEYGELVREFEQVVGPVRGPRAKFDEVAAAGGRDVEALEQIAAQVGAALPVLAEAEDSLREYADAQQMCTRTSGELLNELGQLESKHAGEEKWVELVAWGRQQVQEAAAQAQVRNWFAAHRILSAARHTVAEAGAVVEQAAMTQGALRSRVAALSADATALRVAGATAASDYSRLEAASPADAAPHRETIVAAGKVLARLNAAVSDLNVDPNDSRYNLSELEAEAAQARKNLTDFSAHVTGVLG